MRKNNKVGGIILYDIKLYYMAIVIKTVIYFHIISRHIDQKHRIEILDINPCLYSQLICDKGVKNIHGVKIVYSINGVEKIEQIHAKI